MHFQLYRGYMKTFEFCLVEISTLLFVRTATNYAVVAISIDRVVAVLRPLKYRCNSSKLCSKLWIWLGWIFAFAMGCTTILLHNENFEGICSVYIMMNHIHLLCFGILGKILPCVILIVSNVFVLIKVRRVSFMN